MKCRVCGKEFEKGPFGKKPLCSNTCYGEDFWLEKVRWRSNGDITENNNIVARVKGKHYVIGDEKGDHSFRGMGGEKVTVKFFSGPHTGRTIVSTNLWNQGDIPEHLLEALPDTAELIWEGK